MNRHSISKDIKKPLHRFAYVDALRGYAILGVILIHSVLYAPAFVAKPWRFFVEYGQRGVQLFFVASALTLMFSWYARSSGAVNFYIRRFFRIAPMFYLAIVFFISLHGFEPWDWWVPVGVKVWHVLACFFFVNGLHPESMNSVVPGSWTISVEVIFYCFFPFLVSKLTSFKRSFFFLVAAIIVGKLLRRVVAKTWVLFLPPETAYLAWEYTFFWIFGQLPCFAVGILTYYGIRDYPWRFSQFILKCVLFADLLILVGLALIPLQHGPILNHVASAMAFGMLAYCLASGAGRFLVNRWICSIGKVSYSAYLWHFAIIEVLLQLSKRGIDPIHITSQENGGLFFCLFACALLTTTFLLSKCTYHWVERPMVKFSDRFTGVRVIAQN